MIYRRCGCRDINGKQYGTLPAKNPTEQQKNRACPTMLVDNKHGSYSWRLSRGFDPATGKRIIINGKSYRTLKEAQVELNKARAAKDSGQLHKSTAETLACYAPKWLERRQTTGKRPLAVTTAKMYQTYIAKDIAPSRLGKLKLTDIRRADAQAFVDGLVKAGRGATTVTRVLATLQSILTGAMKDELIPVNPARGVEGPTITKTEKQIWSPVELAAFIKTASEHRLGALFEVALHTALRRGEICGLRWADVDVNRRVIMVRHNRVLVGGTTVTETKPKTDGSATNVELSPAAVAALEGWRVRQDLERSEWSEGWRGEGHVFSMEDGRPLDPSYVTKLFNTLVLKTEMAMRVAQREELASQGLTESEVEQTMTEHPVNLPRLTLHGLRHLAASYMWDATGDILAVSKALRHASPAVTSTVYTHLRGGKQRALFGTIAETLETAGVHTLHTQSLAGA